MLDNAIAALRTYSLIEDDGRLIGVHRLVGTLVRDRLHRKRARQLGRVRDQDGRGLFKFDSIDLLKLGSRRGIAAARAGGKLARRGEQRRPARYRYRAR